MSHTPDPTGTTGTTESTEDRCTDPSATPVPSTTSSQPDVYHLDTTPRTSRVVTAAARGDRSTYIVFLALHGPSLASAPQMHPKWLGTLHEKAAAVLASLRQTDASAEGFATTRGLIIVTNRACPHWYLGWLSRDLATAEVPVRGGATRGQVSTLSDFDGVPNLVGTAVNTAARLANASNNPGFLLLDELSDSFDDDPPPPEWRPHALARRGAEVNVRGKAHEHQGPGANPSYPCFALEDFAVASPAETPKDDSPASPALLVCYDLPRYSSRKEREMSDLFDKIVAAVCDTAQVIRQRWEDNVLFLPGGDGGTIAVLLQSGVEAQVRADVGQFADRLNDNLRFEAGEEVRCSIHEGVIRVWTDINGQRRPGGKAVLEADALTELYPPPAFAMSKQAEKELSNTIWRRYRRPLLQNMVHQAGRVDVPAHYRLVDNAQAAYFFVKNLKDVLALEGDPTNAKPPRPHAKSFSRLVDETLKHAKWTTAGHALLDPVLGFMTAFFVSMFLPALWSVELLWWPQNKPHSPGDLQALTVDMISHWFDWPWGRVIIGCLVVMLVGFLAAHILFWSLTRLTWIVATTHLSSAGPEDNVEPPPSSVSPPSAESPKTPSPEVFSEWQPLPLIEKLGRRLVGPYARSVALPRSTPFPQRVEESFARLWKHIPRTTLVCSFGFSNIVFILLWRVVLQSQHLQDAVWERVLGTLAGVLIATATAFLTWARLRRIDWSSLHSPDEFRRRLRESSQNADFIHTAIATVLAIISAAAILAGEIGLLAGIWSVGQAWLNQISIFQIVSSPGALLSILPVFIVPWGVVYFWVKLARRYQRRIAAFMERATSTADCGPAFVGPHTARLWEERYLHEGQAMTLGALSYLTSQDVRATWVIVDDDNAVLVASPEAVGYVSDSSRRDNLVDLLHTKDKEKLGNALARSRQRLSNGSSSAPQTGKERLNAALRDGREVAFRIIVPTPTEGIRQHRIVVWE